MTVELRSIKILHIYISVCVGMPRVSGRMFNPHKQYNIFISCRFVALKKGLAPKNCTCSVLFLEYQCYFVCVQILAQVIGNGMLMECKTGYQGRRRVSLCKYCIDIFIRGRGRIYHILFCAVKDIRCLAKVLFLMYLLLECHSCYQ